MKKISLSLFLFFILFLSARAAYFERMPFTISQPDGKEISCFVSGDEFFNWIHDEDGYTIIQAVDGYYYYGIREGDMVVPTIYLVNSVSPGKVGLSPWAKISKSEYLRRRDLMLVDKNDHAGLPSKAPLTGTMNNLVVYLRFSDDTEFTTTRQVYDDKFNPSTGVALKSYFKEVSYNNLTISSTHYPACALTTNLSYQDSHARKYFQPYNATTNPTGYNGDTERRVREHQLLVDAITWINANSPVPAGLNIDGDNDNEVDNVCFIVRGNSGGWAELLWAHRWVLYSQSVYINGKRVYDYTFQPENQNTVKTLCHEMFHALGSPDLYHYDDGGLNIDPVGYWDLMESGGGHMLAYMKWKYSGQTWITSIPQITTNGTYSLNPLTSSTNNCYKIASPYSTFEYFVVEYRNKSGTFETNVPGSGLIVYRIDTRETGNASGPPDEVYVYRPGGTTTANGSPSTAHFSSTVGRTAINDGTNPSSFLQNGGLGGLNISNVTTAGATISFTVTFPAPCTPPTTQASAFVSSGPTNTSLTASWTRGNGSGGILVVMKKGSAVDANPVNGLTYNSSSAFGSGDQVGTGNFVVYKGTGTSVNISGLTEGNTYYFALYEYTAGSYCYKSPSLTGIASTTGYCLAGSTATSYEYVSQVVLGNITKSSNRGTGGYENNSNLIINLEKGTAYAATITVTNPYSSDQVIIWADWNVDGDFTDAGETLYTSSGSGFTSPHITATFTPPSGATLGQTRLRIRMHDLANGPNTTPCGNASWGEVEDYTVNVMPVSFKTLQLKVFLEGLYAGNSIMNPCHNENFVPKFGALVADTIGIELRAASDFSLVARYGNLNLATNGTLTLSNIPGNLNASYYICIFHRNSVPVTTAMPVSFTGISTIPYDFTTHSSKTFGIDAQKLLAPNVYGLYSGELDKDANFMIDGSDLNMLEPNITIGLLGYTKFDLDGNGWVDGMDLNIIETNLGLGPYYQRP